jgi:hypothetical protein
LGLGTWIEACTFSFLEDKKENEEERNVEVCMVAMKINYERILSMFCFVLLCV